MVRPVYAGITRSWHLIFRRTLSPPRVCGDCSFHPEHGEMKVRPAPSSGDYSVKRRANDGTNAVRPVYAGITQ